MDDPVVEYIGEGTFEIGVPARALSAAEWEAIPEEIRKRLIAQKIYKLIKASKEIKKEGEK